MATRWGILSAGKISHDFTVGLSTLPKSEHTVVAVAAKDLSRAQQFGKLHGIPTQYGSYQKLAEDKNIGTCISCFGIQPTHNSFLFSSSFFFSKNNIKYNQKNFIKIPL